MANVLAELFQNVASAIREKTGDTGTMKPAEFPDKIRAIEGGGSCTHVPLTVTENGVYRPTKELAFGGAYTFKDSYTQDELKVFYDAYYSETEDAAVLYMNGESCGVAITSVPLDDAVRYILTVMNGEGNFIYVTEEIASALSFGAHGWLRSSDDSAPVSADTPTITFEESGTLYGPSLSDLKSLFALSNADGFSEVTVNVASGGGSGELVPLTVTKNGMYYPPTGNVEIGGTYTFKDSYTQEELQALYNLSTRLDEGDAVLFADDTASVALVVMSMGMMAVANGEEVSMYVGTEVASEIGLSEGWYENGETPIAMESPPTFTFLETGASYVDDITALNVLFDLPSAADGFSSVEVKVDRESDATFEIKEFTFTATSKEQFVEWDLGYVPDITIMTSYRPPVPGSIVMFIIYNRAMLSKLPEGEGGRFKFSIDSQGLALPGNQPLLHAFEDDMNQDYRVFGHPRLATGEGFVVGVGADDDISKYGLTPGDKYVVMTINGIT